MNRRASWIPRASPRLGVRHFLDFEFCILKIKITENQKVFFFETWTEGRSRCPCNLVPLVRTGFFLEPSARFYSKVGRVSEKTVSMRDYK